MSLVIRTDRFAQRAEHGAIEALRSGEIRRPQVNVIDQPADVDLAHGPLLGDWSLLLFRGHHAIVTGLDLGSGQPAVVILVPLLEHLLRAGLVLRGRDGAVTVRVD